MTWEDFTFAFFSLDILSQAWPILLSGLDGLAAVGCQQYTVAEDATDEVTIWVTEVWLTRQAHEDSLQLPETQDAIKRAMPMLTGEFSSVETQVHGGLGLPHLPHAHVQPQAERIERAG